jgi:hypothetical protein
MTMRDACSRVGNVINSFSPSSMMRPNKLEPLKFFYRFANFPGFTDKITAVKANKFTAFMAKFICFYGRKFTAINSVNRLS